MKLIPIIFCDGANWRFWPISREQYIKPFIHLVDGKILLMKKFLGAALQNAVGASSGHLISNRSAFAKVIKSSCSTFA